MGKFLRVLLIEDSDDDAQLLLRELRRSGYDAEFERVETAEAMQVILTEKTWDLILSDYTMPKFSALGALEVLKASRLDLPFIIISGTIGEETAVAALKAGANNFLSKGSLAKLGLVIELELREAEIRRERKQAEQALQTSEELFGTAFHHSPVGICITTLDGKLQNVSQSLLDMLGFTRAELEGKHFNDITHPDDLELGKDDVGRMMAGKIPSVSFEKRYLHKSGAPIWALVSSSLLRNSSGQPAHFITHILNMTERKQAEEVLRAKNEEIKIMSQQLWQTAKLATMGELAASIAHELNNPLATISLRTEMLIAQFSLHDPQSKSLQIIDAELKRMSTLVANLLQFSRRSSAQISTIDLREEVTNTLELIRYHLHKYNILTVQEFSPETPLIQVDRQQLRQVFLNLFTNAADAMPKGGTLTIRTWPGEKPALNMTAPLRRVTTASLGLPVSKLTQVLIEVSDTGEGISPERLERVWEPFYTTKPEGKGTGLGLAICRRIIQEHGGTIEIISDGIPGKGTSVRITLPAVKDK